MDKIKKARVHAYYVLWQTAEHSLGDAFEPEEIKAWTSVVTKMKREYEREMRKHV